MPLNPAAGPAPPLTLEGPGNTPAALSEYWSARPTVLVFLRHFG